MNNINLRDGFLEDDDININIPNNWYPTTDIEDVCARFENIIKEMEFKIPTDISFDDIRDIERLGYISKITEDLLLNLKHVVNKSIQRKQERLDNLKRD